MTSIYIGVFNHRTQSSRTECCVSPIQTIQYSADEMDIHWQLMLRKLITKQCDYEFMGVRCLGRAGDELPTFDEDIIDHELQIGFILGDEPPFEGQTFQMRGRDVKQDISALCDLYVFSGLGLGAVLPSHRGAPRISIDEGFCFQMGIPSVGHPHLQKNNSDELMSRGGCSRPESS
eukprot:gene4181-biopygen12444